MAPVQLLIALFETWTMPSRIAGIIDIPYGVHSHSLHKWDLFYPRSDTKPKPLSIIVFVHGGAWRRYYSTCIFWTCISLNSPLVVTNLSIMHLRVIWLRRLGSRSPYQIIGCRPESQRPLNLP